MRLGRLLLASLTALAAYSYAQAAPETAHAHESLRILQVVVPLLAHASDSVSTAPVVKAAPQAIFALETLNTTSLAGSLILVSSIIAIDLILRCHTKQLLRC